MYLMLIIIIIILLISTLVGEKNKSYPFNKILPKQDFCKIIQFTRSTIPENIKCYVKKNLILIIKNINKNLYITGNEIENMTIKYNKIYTNFIIDIFVWDTTKYYYKFLKIDFFVYKKIIILKSIKIINNKVDTIQNRIGDYALFLPKKSQDRKNFIKDNEYLQKSVIRNKWI